MGTKKIVELVSPIKKMIFVVQTCVDRLEGTRKHVSSSTDEILYELKDINTTLNKILVELQKE